MVIPFDNLEISLVLVSAEYCGVFLAILADLWSGWRKAVAMRQKRTSRALRRTVDKVARYFNALIALTVLDAMVMTAAAYLQETQSWSIPAFPLFSMTGAIGLALIEIKSICENIGKKKELKQASDAIGRILRNADRDKIIQAVIDVLRPQDT